MSNHTVETVFGPVHFCCPNNEKLLVKRASRLLTKEPDTIQWINTFELNDIFWDIGANVGCFSLYAGKKGVKTFSFEPAAINFQILNENIFINHLDNKIVALCIAFSDIIKVDYFYFKNLEPGGALNSLSEPRDYKNKLFEPIFKQGIISYTIDSFISQFSMDVPTHIKIDVDGIENKIINGTHKTFLSNKLKSILVELDIRTSKTKEVISTIEKAGFKLFLKSQTGTGEFSFICNYIFKR